MSKTNASTKATLPKRLSPELAEVLHMLKSLEAQPNTKVAPVSVR